MRHTKLLLGIVCMFAFLACGQGEKVEQSTKSDVKQPVEMIKEKAEGAAEMMKEKSK
jgi:hypothetical protein